MLIIPSSWGFPTGPVRHHSSAGAPSPSTMEAEHSTTPKTARCRAGAPPREAIPDHHQNHGRDSTPHPLPRRHSRPRERSTTSTQKGKVASDLTLFEEISKLCLAIDHFDRRSSPKGKQVLQCHHARPENNGEPPPSTGTRPQLLA
jgi:hypothetical protein